MITPTDDRLWASPLWYLAIAALLLTIVAEAVWLMH